MQRSEYSEEMAAKIYRRVREIAVTAYEKASSMLKSNRSLLDRLVDRLVEKETIDGDEFRGIVSEYIDIPTAN